MKLVWATAIWLSFTNFLWAEPILVQGEDKNQFSRLSFLFPKPVRWRLEQTDDGYDVIFENLQEKLDLSKVFDGMSRVRIGSLNLSSNGTRLRIGVDCPCTAEAFEYRPGFLTIKIFGNARPSTEVINNGVIEESPELSGRVIPLPSTFSILAKDIPPRVGVFSAERKPLETAKAVDEESSQIPEMREQVLLQISRAASQGLVEAKLKTEVTTTQPETKRMQDPSPSLEVGIEPEPNINSHVETSVDRTSADPLGGQRLTDLGATCIENSVLDIDAWGDPGAVFDRIAHERINLTEEFDQVDRSALTRYVQANLYAGFGAEAVAAQFAFEETTSYPQIYTQIANLMDGEEQTKETIFDNQIGCEGRSAMWAALSSENLKHFPFINRQAVTLSFAELPAHLRKHLGPRLANKFVDIDDFETAQTLRNAIERTVGKPTSEMTLLEAQIDHARGQDQFSLERLEKVIAQDDAFAITALITLFKAKVDAHQEIQPDMILTAQSMVFEQNGTKQSDILQTLVALAQSQKGQFSQAIASMNELEQSPYIGEFEKTKIWAALLKEAVESTDSITFVKFTYAALDQLRKRPLAKQIRIQAAKKLLAEGFPHIAIQVVNPSGQPSHEEIIILAKAALQEGRPNDALKYAVALPQELATSIRAHAFIAQGNLEMAAQEFTHLPKETSRDIALWQLGDWSKLEQLADGVEKKIALLMSPQQNELSYESNELIQISRARLADSNSTKTTIFELLEKFESVAPIIF